MSPERLLKHFEQISEAPGAVPRLRRFILDLAVRGKIVEQDPADEPASELLKRIETENSRLVANGEIKQLKPLYAAALGDLGFDLPKNWTVSRLGAVAICLDYRRIPVNNEERVRRIDGKSSEQLFPYFGATQQQGWIDDFIFDEEILLLGEDGVSFFDQLRPKAYLVSGKSWVNNHAHVFRGIFISNRFLIHWLNVFDYTGRVAGATRSKLNQSKAVDIPVPLPPLAEQQRIVAKVDELMALCEKLEAAQAKREKRRDRLVTATLHGLNNGDAIPAPGPRPTFKDSARFFLNHLPHLTTRPKHIHQLRQTILNLAVRGKLVQQDPNDELASELLKRIQIEKARLLSQGNIRKQKALPSIGVVPFDIPRSWEWTRLGDLCFTITDGTHITPQYTDKGVPFLSVKDVSSGKIYFSNTRFVTQETHAALCKRCKSERNDILLTKVGTTGIAVLVDTSREFSIFVSLALLKFATPEISPPFLVHLLNSPFVRKQSEDNTQGIGNKNLVLRLINLFMIPLPPLAEQYRIVAKVGELIALCDEIEAMLNSSTTARRSLIEATLYNALSL
jgi:type I restriction enzyme, S subunit